jgi:phosphate transport system substrate-binding protein
MTAQNSVTHETHRRGRNLKARYAKAAIALSIAIGLGGVGSVAAGAAKAKAGTSSLTSLEKQLSSFESADPSGATLTEAGSSLIYPLMVEWEGHGLAAGLSPAAGGSGKGQSGAETGIINIGGSDPYLPATTLTTDGVLNVPLAVSAQLVNYNIPGLSVSTHLKLNGTILNEIYAGTITMWNDPAIEAINKGVKIPTVKIVPIHRSDSSGDTFLFTTYLYDQDPSGVASSGPAQLLSWPDVKGELAESGNAGMQSGCIATPGCVAYIGISYERGSTEKGLGSAELQNGYAGKGSPHYITPDTNSINDEVASFKNIPASGGLSLIDSHSAPEGYPIVNFEYAIVKQNNPKAAAVKGFLAWAMDPREGSASTYLAPVDFRPLPENALAVAVSLLSQIS